MAPEKTIEKYRGKYMTGWDKLREQRRQQQVEMGLIDKKWALSPRPDDTPAWESLTLNEKKRYDHMMAIYAAMIEELDKNVGKLVDGLKARGELDNTLILFLSDNGGSAESGVKGRYKGPNQGGPKSNVFIGQCWAMLNNTPFRKYKHYTHEGGISTPLIAHWPIGIPKERNGTIDNQPGHLVDIMSTLVDIAGAKYPTEYKGHSIEPMEGTSLVPSFGGKSLDRDQPIFFQHEANRAIRSGKWKLVALRDKPWELYDMDADRTELNDLSGKYPELVAQLAKQHDAWAIRTHADLWKERNK